MKTSLFIAVCFLLMLATTQSKAQLRVGGSYGIYLPQGDFGDKKVANAGMGNRIGLSLGVKYKKVLVRIELDNNAYGENDEDFGKIDHNILSSVLVGRYYFNTTGFMPYVTGYGGLASYEVDFGGGFKPKNSSLLTCGGGIGVEKTLIGNLSAELTAVYNLVFSDKKKFKDGITVKALYSANSIGVNLGVNYRFSVNPLGWLLPVM